jgi:hypothetical protein
VGLDPEHYLLDFWRQQASTDVRIQNVVPFNGQPHRASAPLRRGIFFVSALQHGIGRITSSSVSQETTLSVPP